MLKEVEAQVRNLNIFVPPTEMVKVAVTTILSIFHHLKVANLWICLCAHKLQKNIRTKMTDN